MKDLARYLEELHVGEFHDPQTNRREVIKERVTVCPSCSSLRSLRHEGELVHCLVCLWDTPASDRVRAAK